MLDLITAIIKPHKLDDVKAALLANGVEGMTVSEVRGFGRQRGKTENFRGIGVPDRFPAEDQARSDRAVGLVRSSDRRDRRRGETGKIGDGKIWKITISSLLRVRTGEMDIEAI